MRLKYTRLTSICITLGGIMAYAGLTSYSGGNPGNTTNGCSTGGTCHGGSANAATVLSITGIPSGGWVPGTAYTLTASVTNTAKTGAGFDLGCSTGTFSGNPTNTALINANKEIYHTAPKTMTSGTASWSFTWTAPATGSSVTFNFAGNAVNLNGASSGDVWNTSTQTFNAAAATVTVPTVTLGTVTGITNTTATINASVNANGGSTTIAVQYGLTTAYGSLAASNPATVSGTIATAITSTLTGLTPNRTYHYRITAGNSAGITNSADGTFNTTNLSVASISAAGFKMYPNPVQGVLMIESATAKSVLDIRVTDATGKSIAAPVSQAGTIYRVNVAGLTSGMYWLRLKDGGLQYSSPFVKQ